MAPLVRDIIFFTFIPSLFFFLSRETVNGRGLRAAPYARGH